MPLNTLRLNAAPSSHPNSLVTFIKPLPNLPTTDHASTYLYAISAIVLPIMKKFHLAITTLEEHEPNPEFVGRNFNNGEIVQLVLRRRGRGDADGGWLPFRQVQMVMMHELAHNVQMNHGKAFWVERNRFAAELKELWGRGYTGDGLWGSGRALEDAGIREGNAVSVGSSMGDGVENLCGGTYRSRRRKRRRAPGPDLTWKEKRDRRIEKKFGKNGMALGEDEDKRLMLEIGRKGPLGGKPRVANSKRGRELRAAAALKRFGNQQTEEEMKKEDDEDAMDDEYEEDDTTGDEIARDRNGQRLLDNMGFGLVKVCEEEDADDINVKREQKEMDDLGVNNLSSIPRHETAAKSHQTKSPASTTRNHKIAKPSPKAPTIKSEPDDSLTAASPSSSITTKSTPTSEDSKSTSTAIPSLPCPLCTLSNPSTSLLCAACSHVLHPDKVAGSWTCTRPSCGGANGTRMINAGDAGACGACGGRREARNEDRDGG
ncbi:MAG: hypothetical protein Q9160_004062 [Pyrenula sp. 1 TL-2023]